MPCASSSIAVSIGLLLLFAPVAVAQQPAGPAPVDSSFTTQNAWEKVRHQFPEAAIVRAEPDSTISVSRDIVYASRNGRDLHIDVYRPITPETLPAVLIIHGGGWSSGYRQMEAPIACAMAAHKYVALTIEYRLSGEARYPAALYDIRDGLRWMRRHCNEFGIDSDSVAVLGPSAGGTLALLAGTMGICSCVKAMVSIDGVPDMTDPAESGKDTGSAALSAGARWLGATYAHRPALWREASPVFHAGPDSPPVLFINSSIPRFHAGRDSMVATLARCGIPSVVRSFSKSPHTFWLFHPWFEQTVRWTIDFLDHTLKKIPDGHNDGNPASQGS